jgi:hypothetical protein
MDEKMNFSEHVNVMVGKVSAMLGFIRRQSFEFRDPCTLKFLSVHILGSSKVGVWSPFYDVRVDKVERMLRRFIRNALHNLGWTDMSMYVLFCAFTIFL